MATMQAVQISDAGGDFELVKRDIPSPGPGEVRVRVEACGICHSDAFVKEGTFPGLQYPRVPGHEVAGRIDAVGEGVTAWQRGQRVGVGWHGGHCWHCQACREGDFVACEQAQITGVTRDGGYAQYMLADAGALVRVPDELESMAAAPLLCAGITTFNALRNSSAGPGDTVAIQGLGGLGHLAVQYAHAMGFRTVVISRGTDKREQALKLGADDYIDASQQQPAEALQQMGGARVLLSTAPSGASMTPLVDGLGRNGQLLVIGAASDAIEVTPFQLIMARRSLIGWPSGSPVDSEETLRFSTLKGPRAMIETFPLNRAQEAYDHMISNNARFRVVLTVD